MAASSLFQVTALPLMHLSFLFNASPFTATFASVANSVLEHLFLVDYLCLCSNLLFSLYFLESKVWVEKNG